MTSDDSAPGETPPPARPRPPFLDRIRSVLRRRGAGSSRDQLETALASVEPFTGVSPKERSMLRNVLDLHNVRISDVMVPRVDIIAIPADTPLSQVLHTFREAAHSRLPVYNETLDDPRGMIHIRDFVDFLASRADAVRSETPADEHRLPHAFEGVALDMSLSQARILRPVLFVPPSMSAVDLLVKMQQTRTHMALVIDEYGGTDGLVSIEDLVEVIVGDIEDEHDVSSAPNIIAESDGVFVADARAPLEEVSAAVGRSLLEDAEAEDVDTIGGLVVTLAGRVPVRGEIIAGPGELEFEILEADARRVSRLRIHPRRGMVELRRRRARRGADAGAPAPAKEQPTDGVGSA